MLFVITKKSSKLFNMDQNYFLNRGASLAISKVVVRMMVWMQSRGERAARKSPRDVSF